jgi:hypothetical protein
MIRIVRNLGSVAAVMFVFGACAPIAWADGGASTPRRDVGEFVTPQGTVDLDALLKSGVDGAVDLSGYRMTLDEAQSAIRAIPDGPGSFSGAAPEPASASRATGDENWWGGFGSPGVNDRVFALAVYDGALILGGEFRAAGGVGATGVVRWDGTSWSSLGSGTNGGVRCLQVHDGALIAAGYFLQAGGASANRVAQWDGTSWSPLGSGFDWVVQTLAVYDGELIAGGEFHYSGTTAIDHLARWDGTNWTPLGGGANNAVWGLGTFGTELLVGGDFDQIGGQTIAKVAVWNGATFNPMGTWTSPGPPRSFVTHQGLLYAGTWERVYQWDGAVWVNLEFPGGGSGRALGVYDDKLVAIGWGFQRAYSWDGTAWSALGAGIGWEAGDAVTVFNGKLYVGGWFFRAGSANVLHVASWDGSNWAGLGASTNQGIGGRVYALATYQGDVFAGGEFSVAGGVAVNNVARWDGTAWHPLGEGVHGNENRVEALCVYDGGLVVAGSFEYAGAQRIVDLARWDGATWSSLGGGNDGGHTSALVLYHGDLIAAGDLHWAGGVSVNHIARWDGIAWHPLGSGIDGCDVRALTVSDDNLIAGGCFSEAGGAPGNAVARWDGVSWSPIGVGLAGEVNALAEYQGEIVAGGSFNAGGGLFNLARWDSTAWVPVGGSFDGPVWALSVVNGDLYAGGQFGYVAGGPPVHAIARYDGSNWNSLGSGAGVVVHAIIAAEDPTGLHLYLGGQLNWAGDNIISAGIARWHLRDTTHPILRSVTDIGNDQGRQVRLRWRRDQSDAPDQSVTITGYAVFREQGQNKAGSPSTTSRLSDIGTDRADLRMDGWDYILTVPAFGDTSYQCVAPTLCDSTISGGLCLSTFMVRAMTPSPFEYYDSAPLSGYSVDNLTPATPANLHFQSPAVLAWDETAAPDFDYYGVYGSSGPVFDPQAAVLIGYTTIPEMNVAGNSYLYLHVTATDFAGNEGPAAGIQNLTTDVEGGMVLPARFALYPCQPNPTVGFGVIRFDLPRESDLSLRLFDVAGREVVTLAHGRYPAGQHEVRLDTKISGRLPAGVYLYRLDAGSFSETRKMQVIGR